MINFAKVKKCSQIAQIIPTYNSSFASQFRDQPTQALKDHNIMLLSFGFLSIKTIYLETKKKLLPENEFSNYFYHFREIKKFTKFMILIQNL